MNSPPDPFYDVVILGAGFSGSLVAVHLTATAAGPRMVLIEKSHSYGAGLAYGAASQRHLLNVPAGRMSAFPGAPDHFLQWLRARPDLTASFGLAAIEAGSFLPRRLYGSYLTSLVEDSVRTSNRLNLMDAEAIDIVTQSDGSFLVQLTGGTQLRAGTLVLASGNFASSHPSTEDRSFLHSRRYLGSPWSPAAAQALTGPGDVLILGTGLTMLDLLVTLRDTKPVGRIHLLSRRGLIPQPHQPVAAHNLTFAWQQLPPNMRGIVQRVRTEIARAANHGVDWRPVIDSLRPITQTLWCGLTATERRRFLRHIRPYWEVRRHRAAPEVFQALESLEKEGRLVYHRGRAHSITEVEEGIEVVFQSPERRDSTVLKGSAVVNCTGPETDVRKIEDPLITNILWRGLINPDELGLGIQVTLDGQVIDSAGNTAENFYAMGALRKGRLWETTAVPELRAQAAALAERLLLQWSQGGESTMPPPSTLPALNQIWAYEI